MPHKEREEKHSPSLPLCSQVERAEKQGSGTPKSVMQRSSMCRGIKREWAPGLIPAFREAHNPVNQGEVNIKQ